MEDKKISSNDIVKHYKKNKNKNKKSKALQ